MEGGETGYTLLEIFNAKLIVTFWLPYCHKIYHPNIYRFYTPY